jgi:hypothetical protein
VNAGETLLDINWPFRFRLGLAVEGMAAWHLLLTLLFLALIGILAAVLALLALASGGHPEASLYVIFYSLGVLAVGLTLSATLSTISFAVLSRGFRRRDWPLICWPGALGTAVAIIAFIVWPLSATIGVSIACKMTDGKVRRESNASRNDP